VLKGSEIAPQCSYIFAEIVAEAGLPDGVFNLVSGTGPELGEAIASHPLIDVISLTGSVRAGQRVMELGAATIKRVILELGGKSPNVVLPDADIQRAIAVGIDDAFRNTGQACGALSRILVPRERLRDAEEIAAERAESFVLGDPFDPKTTLGPVVSAAQRDRIRGYIRSGIAEAPHWSRAAPMRQKGSIVGTSYGQPCSPLTTALASPARRSSDRWWSSSRSRTRPMRSHWPTTTAWPARSGRPTRTTLGRSWPSSALDESASTARRSTNLRRTADSNCPASAGNGAASGSRSSSNTSPSAEIGARQRPQASCRQHARRGRLLGGLGLSRQLSSQHQRPHAVGHRDPAARNQQRLKALDRLLLSESGLKGSL
jgi:hypothetical protein